MARRKSAAKPKPKQIWVKKPNWLNLPDDITANILHRLGAIEILRSAQRVCTSWRRICKDPAMWKVIDMRSSKSMRQRTGILEGMCKNAVDRSQWQMVELNFEYFGNDDLMDYIADRSTQLRRLKVSCAFGIIFESWSSLFKKTPLLEEITLRCVEITDEEILDAARYCPMLKTFRYNDQGCEENVIAIARGFPGLHHLQLVGNAMTNKGLQAILDWCPQLESLDIRDCFNINLDEGLRKICADRFKDLRLPDDSTEDFEFADDDDNNDVDDADCDFEGMSNYDIYCGPYNPCEFHFYHHNSD